MNSPSPRNQVCLIATLVARSGQEEALLTRLRTLVPLVHQEPGCVQYTLHADAARPNVFVFYEVWQDEAALDAHGKTPHFTAFVTGLDDLLAQPLDIVKLRRIA